jgi:hypothetical protein
MVPSSKDDRSATQQSAGATAEPHGPAADVVEHLERPLLQVADDPRGPVIAGGREGEAAAENDPRRVELHRGAPLEHEGDARDLDVAGEVEARVQERRRRHRPPRVHPHLLPERRPERAVRLGRQPRDDRPRVHDRAGAERRRGHAEAAPGHGDAPQEHEVERAGVAPPVHGRDREPRRGGARRAEREKPGVARRRREAVREGLRPRLRHERRRATAETHEPVGHVGEQLRGVAATEPEAVDGARRVQRQFVGAVRPGGVGAVAIPDGVLAPAAPGAAIAVEMTAETLAGGRAATEGGVRGRPGRVEQLVLLGVARRGGARAALHPRDVAAGVHEHGLGDRRRAEAHGDDVLQGVQRGAERGRDGRIAALCSSRAVQALPDAVGAEPVPSEHVGRRGHARRRRGGQRRARTAPVVQRQPSVTGKWNAHCGEIKHRVVS